MYVMQSVRMHCCDIHHLEVALLTAAALIQESNPRSHTITGDRYQIKSIRKRNADGIAIEKLGNSIIHLNENYSMYEDDGAVP